jgi:hypothetical protein
LKQSEGRVKEGTLHLEQVVCFLVRAERAQALGRDINAIQTAHDEAIASAARHDLPNYEALANERAGRALNDDSAFLRRAFDQYIDLWGALARQIKDLLPRIESQNSDTISVLWSIKSIDYQVIVKTGYVLRPSLKLSRRYFILEILESCRWIEPGGLFFCVASSRPSSTLYTMQTCMYHLSSNSNQMISCLGHVFSGA